MRRWMTTPTPSISGRWKESESGTLASCRLSVGLLHDIFTSVETPSRHSEWKMTQAPERARAAKKMAEQLGGVEVASRALAALAKLS